MEDGLLEGGLNRGRGLNCYSLSADTVHMSLRMTEIQITKSLTLAMLDHSQHIKYSITFKKNQINIECFTHTIE